MLTEKEIEGRLKEKLSEVFPVKPLIIGSWDVKEEGEVKGSGNGDTCVLAVSVGIRQYATFQTPQADIPCSLALSIRRDTCPTGGKLAELMEPLMCKMHEWNADADAVFDDLKTDTFNPGGFQLDGGNLSQTSDAWTATVSFTLRGIVTATTTGVL